MLINVVNRCVGTEMFPGSLTNLKRLLRRYLQSAVKMLKGFFKRTSFKEMLFESRIMTSYWSIRCLLENPRDHERISRQIIIYGVNPGCCRVGHAEELCIYSNILFFFFLDCQDELFTVKTEVLKLSTLPWALQ